jgi:hypothetical protein
VVAETPIVLPPDCSGSVVNGQSTVPQSLIGDLAALGLRLARFASDGCRSHQRNWFSRGADKITPAYFPHSGVISLAVGLPTDEMVEAVIGRFGFQNYPAHDGDGIFVRLRSLTQP